MNRPTDTDRPTDTPDETGGGARPEGVSATPAAPGVAEMSAEADSRTTDAVDASGAHEADPAAPGPRREADGGPTAHDPDGTGDESPRMADDPGVTDEWRAEEQATGKQVTAARPSDEAIADTPQPPAETETGTPEPAKVDDALETRAEDLADSGGEAGRTPEPAARSRRDDTEPQEDEEDHGMGVAGRLLVLLVVAIVGGIGALYAAPRLAPHVPAAVAKYLIPGQPDTLARLDALGASLAATEARLVTLEAALAERAGQDALRGVADAVAALDSRISALETETGGLAGRLDTLGTAAPTPAPAAEAAAAPVPQGLADDLAALAARLDEVAATAEATSAAGAEVAALRAEVAALEARVDGIETARTGEIARLEQAVLSSALDRAIAALSDRAASGLAFETELAEVERLSGQAAPDVLTTSAPGLPSATQLARSISEPARAALAADIRAGAEPGILGQLGAWARSQVVMRPTVAREGDDVASVLSRIAARLEAGDAVGAEAEAAGLPDHARQAMAGWLDALTARAAADAALADWVATLGANG